MISVIVATELRCWVMPIAQQVMVAEDSRNIWAACSMSARDSPVARSTASQSRAAMFSAHSSKPTVCRSMNSRSMCPDWRSSAPMAWNSARSPLTRTGRCRSERSVPLPITPRGFCGFLKLTRPASWPAITISSAA